MADTDETTEHEGRVAEKGRARMYVALTPAIQAKLEELLPRFRRNARLSMLFDNPDIKDVARLALVDGLDALDEELQVSRLVVDLMDPDSLAPLLASLSDEEMERVVCAIRAALGAALDVNTDMKLVEGGGS